MSETPIYLSKEAEPYWGSGSVHVRRSFAVSGSTLGFRVQGLGFYNQKGVSTTINGNENKTQFNTNSPDPSKDLTHGTPEDGAILTHSYNVGILGGGALFC